jgi:hypothetical protein
MAACAAAAAARLVRVADGIAGVVAATPMRYCQVLIWCVDRRDGLMYVGGPRLHRVISRDGIAGPRMQLAYDHVNRQLAQLWADRPDDAESGLLRGSMPAASALRTLIVDPAGTGAQHMIEKPTMYFLPNALLIWLRTAAYHKRLGQLASLTRLELLRAMEDTSGPSSFPAGSTIFNSREPFFPAHERRVPPPPPTYMPLPHKPRATAVACAAPELRHAILVSTTPAAAAASCCGCTEISPAPPDEWAADPPRIGVLPPLAASAFDAPQTAFDTDVSSTSKRRRTDSPTR